MYTDNFFNRFVLAPEVSAALQKCKFIAYAETREELEEMVYGPTHTSRYDVVYPIEGRGVVKEAEVVRCKNGPAVNFMEDYMRRRDPNSMVIGDDLPTDKLSDKDIGALHAELTDPRFKDEFWTNEIQAMLAMNKKSEQQALATSYSFIRYISC